MKFLRPLLPEILMVAIMAAVALAYMSPVFEGKTLAQGDVMHAQDQTAGVEKFQKETGVYPGWTNSAFSGMPTYQLKSPPSKNVYNWLFRFFKFYLPGYTVAILFVAFLGFYFLLRTLMLNRWLALAGALAFGLGSHHVQLILAGHINKLYAIAYMAPVIAGMLLVFRRKYLAGGLLTAVALGIQISTNHVQVTYYLGMIVFIYLFTELVFALREKYFDHFLKSVLVLFAALVLAILPNMTMLLTTYEYTQETTRGKTVLETDESNKSGLNVDYITQWSYGVGETFNLFIPNLYGGGGTTNFGENSKTLKAIRQQQMSQDNARYVLSKNYWGRQPFTAGPHYLGAITILLAILGLLLVRGPKKWWLIIVIALSIMLAWGRNFMVLTEFFVNHVPLYGKFRDSTNALIIAQFALPLLSFLAIRSWVYDEKRDAKEKLKKLYLATGIAGGFTLLVLLVPGLLFGFSSPDEVNFPDWLQSALQADRLDLARKDAFRTLIFVLLGAGVLWATLKTKIKPVYLYAGLAFLILVDLWTVDKRYLNNDRFESKRKISQTNQPSAVDQAIFKDKDLSYRVLDITSGDPFRWSRPSRFHKSIGGYHGAKLGRYQDIIDKYLTNEVGGVQAAFKDNPTQETVMAAVNKMAISDLLNTRYIIYSLQAAPIVNNNAFGNVWFADNVIQVNTASEEITALGDTDLHVSAIVNSEFADLVNTLPDISFASSNDRIELTVVKPDYLAYASKTGTDRLAVFSEIWYPHGWKAFIDGKAVDILRADYLLRALYITAGEHKIEFKFAPASLKTGQLIAINSSILV
ncbi:MAG: YfhO family protein, partial [Bacteroidales bacterium]|nr:YfhO family protein [Bacteroidales bacterium]